MLSLLLNDSVCADHGNITRYFFSACRNGVFDCIFMDPPYNHELERQVLEYLQNSSVLDENTLIIIEADLATDFSYVEALGYRQLRSKEYKTNKHIFLCRESE